MHSMFGNTSIHTCVRTMGQVKSKKRNRTADETWIIVSVLLPLTLVLIMGGRVREASTTGIPAIEICSYLLLCNHFNDALTYLPFLVSCESFVSYIILLDVARKLSRFCKMSRRSNIVGPRQAKVILTLLY